MTATSRPPRLLALLGSATPPGRLTRAVQEATGRADAAGDALTEVVDLARVTVGPAGVAPSADDDTARVVAALESADAVLLATPVYRGSFTGVLKNLLDHVPVAALRGTPVGIVAMGATDHHHLGVERHLRDVLAFFGALVAPTAVYLTSADFTDGAPGPHAAADLDALVAALLRLAAAGLGDLGPAPLAARGRGG